MFQPQSAVTAGGAQAHESQINNEMQNRALGQNAMQLNQQGMMHSDRMNQADDQFAAQLGESQRQREHEIGREDIGYGRATEVMTKQQEFQAAQANALREWQIKQTQKSQQFELEIEKLGAMREMARDKGQLDAVATFTTQMTELRKQRSKKAMSTALSSRMLGKTTRENEAMLDMLTDQLKRKVSVEQENIALAGKFVPSLTSRIDKMSQEASMRKFQEFHDEQQQHGDAINPLAPTFGDVGSAVSTGALEGLEWLNLQPSRLGRLYGMGGSTTTQGSAFKSYVDPGTMAETIKGRIVEGTIQQLGEMGFKNLNQGAARNLVMAAMSGRDKAEIARLSAAAGIPTSTLKYLFDGGARAYENTTNNPRYQQLMQRDAEFRQAAGYQENDLKVLAMTKAKEAYGTTQKYYRTAASAFDDMDLSDYNAGIEVLGELRKRGQFTDLAGSTLSRLGMSEESERLRKLMSRIPQAREDLEESAIGLGDIEEESSAMQAMAPLMMGRGAAAGTPAYLGGIEDLIRRYGENQ